jgi:hypothetical protein
MHRNIIWHKTLFRRDYKSLLMAHI